MLKVGYIGLGHMGRHIARNILQGGFPLVVHNRSQKAVEELVSEGAVSASSPAEVASQVDVVFTNLPDSLDVELVALGPKGIIEGAHDGLIFVDNSTIKPASARKIAEKLSEVNVMALDAPVSGGDIGAKNATLTIMVGGPEEALNTVRPILEKCGKTITHIGDSGSGQIAKAANQIMVVAQLVALAELLVFTQKAGADPKKTVAAIRGGAAQCWALDVKPQRLFAGNREPGFISKLQLKDINIIMDTAREYGIPLPALAEHAQLFQSLVLRGYGDLDNSAIIKVIEDMADIQLIEPDK